MKYFPQIETQIINYPTLVECSFKTAVRIQYKEIWYDIVVRDSFRTVPQIDNQILPSIVDKMIPFQYYYNIFVNKAYSHSLLFILTDEMLKEKNEKGLLKYPPSKLQITEEERLKQELAFP